MAHFVKRFEDKMRGKLLKLDKTSLRTKKFLKNDFVKNKVVGCEAIASSKQDDEITSTNLTRS